MQPASNPLRIIAVLALLAGFAVMAGGEAFAGTGLLAQAPAPAPAQNVVSGRSFTVEIGIVVVMFGGALFAVCRSSSRT